MNKNVTIEWRARSEATFLPASDLRWSPFCVLVASPRAKEGPIPEAVAICGALNDETRGGYERFEFRISPRTYRAPNSLPIPPVRIRS